MIVHPTSGALVCGSSGAVAKTRNELLLQSRLSLFVNETVNLSNRPACPCGVCVGVMLRDGLVWAQPVEFDTVSTVLPEIVFKAAEMVLVPAVLPVPSPPEATSATAVFDDDHVTLLVSSCVLLS